MELFKWSLRTAATLALAVALSNCAKSDNSTSSGGTTTTSSTGLYLTCSSNGYYVFNYASYSCTSGASVYISTATAGNTFTCPTAGSYTYLGISYTCTANTTVTLSTSTTSTGSYITCPTTGSYTYNGYTYTCTPGQLVLEGGTGTTTTTTTCQAAAYSSTECQQYACQYNVPYKWIPWNGSNACVRYDIAAYYGY